MLWYPLLGGNVNKSQSHQLGDSCFSLCRGLDSVSVVLNSIDSQRKWPQKKKLMLVCLWRLLNTPVIWKNDLSWNIAGRLCDLYSLDSLPAADFLALLVSSTSPSILVQSVLYLCHPLLKDDTISHLLNFWTGSHMNSCTTSKGASEGICHGCDLEL